MKKILAGFLIILSIAIFGCQSSGTKPDDSQPVAKKSRKVAGQATVYIYLNRNIPKGMRADKAKAQAQIGDWMEKDLGNILRRKGKYNTEILQSPSAFKGGSNTYLLNIKIVKYNPGSYAARTFVGFGAGSASMDITYELKNTSGKSILKASDGIGSGRDWRNVAKKLNANMFKAIKTKI